MLRALDSYVTPSRSVSIHLPDLAATSALGARLADALLPGHVVLLHGDLGAGKSSLARSAIRAVLGEDQDVPSPTYTLIQEYQSSERRIVHCDLYRLSEPEEIEELGLLSVFEKAAALVEWPERLADELPTDRLDIRLAIGAAGGRDVVLTPTGKRGEAMLRAVTRSRDDLIAQFVERAGWGAATIEPLAGDASNRRYLRLNLSGTPAVLMDAPTESGEDVRPFVSVTQALRDRGLSAPEIFSSDAAHGFLLLEDLGDALYARLCERNAGLERPIYEAAVDLIAELRTLPDEQLPPYDAAVLTREASLLTDWWVPGAGGEASEDMRAEYLGLMAAATEAVSKDRSALVLRDYHAENLIWLPERAGLARVGLLDYQDALLGHPAYDLVSLLEDARRDVSPAFAEALISRFLAARNDLDPNQFRAGYDALGAQRNAKIVGIFARLSLRDAKPHYVDLIPRVWAHFMRDLSSESMKPLRTFIERYVPEPTPDALARAKG